MKGITVGEVLETLEKYPNDTELCTYERTHDGVRITAINFVGVEGNGNLVVGLDRTIIGKGEQYDSDTKTA